MERPRLAPLLPLVMDLTRRRIVEVRPIPLHPLVMDLTRRRIVEVRPSPVQERKTSATARNVLLMSHPSRCLTRANSRVRTTRVEKFF
jgi:hypothetical protein